ncbi:MAG: GNAT family N-acetyltransferase [Acidobacteriaceae bacterium]
MNLRLAEPSDAMAVARVHVRSWQAAYRGLLPDAYLDQLRPEDRAARYDFATTDPAKPRTIVAEADGAIGGFATTMPSRDTDTVNHGELCALYVDPNDWGRGYGRSLIEAARRHLSACGFSSAMLWLLEGNLRADRFYRADGWLPDGTRRTETMWDITVNEIRYRGVLDRS